MTLPVSWALAPANVVTLARAILACGVAALAAGPAAPSASGPAEAAGLVALVALASAALVLDAVDGWVARRTGTVSDFGARFDMEVDAFLILVLSAHVARAIGWWVVAIGAARYTLLVAQRLAPWLRRGLPPSRWRKAVAAYQGIALTAAAANQLPVAIVTLAVVGGLVALGISFGTEIWSLWRLRLPGSAIVGTPARAQMGSVVG